MATRARSSAHLSVVNAITKRHHLLRRPCRNREPGIRVCAFRRFGIGRVDRPWGSRCARAWSRLRPATGRAAHINNVVYPPGIIVGDVERPVRSDRKATWTMHGFLWCLDRPGESVGKYFARTSCTGAGKRLKDNVVAPLGKGCPVPGTVEGDEHAIAVVSGELFPVVEHRPIGPPMRGKSCHRSGLVSADAHLTAAVSTVFGRKHQ